MRRFGLAIMLIAAVPAIAIPLLAGIAAMSAPAALIAAIAALSMPATSHQAVGEPVVSHAAIRAEKGVGNYAQR